MKRFTEEEIKEEIKLYKHKLEGQVKFHEVDSFRVVHNIQYFYFCEWARTKYLEDCGMIFDKDTFTRHTPLMTVNHEMNYFNPLMLSEKYMTYSRCSHLGKSSIILDNIILNTQGQPIIRLSSTLVNVDTKTNRPAPIPDELRTNILNYEGDNLNLGLI